MVRVPGTRKGRHWLPAGVRVGVSFRKGMCRCGNLGSKATYVIAVGNGNESVLPAG